MQIENPYTLISNISLLQRQAGVDPDIAELVTAFTRIRADAGREIVFYPDEITREDLSTHFVHRWLVDRNPNVDPRVLQFLVSYSNLMSGRKLPFILNTSHFAKKMGMSLNQIMWIARNQSSLYKQFEIPKSNGSARQIAEPIGQLLTMQGWLQRKILVRGKPHKYATAFIRGRSIMSNVRPHTGREVVVRIDLKDFFHSITHQQVRKVFERFGYPYKVAVLMANLCTLDGHLPQGAPTSPSLSNLVCVKLDRRFTGLKKKLEYRYTRYADDLVFSSDNPKFPALIPFLKEVIREEGFTVNEDKVSIMRKGQQQKVTGVVLNEKPNLPRKHVRKLRAVAHRMKTLGPDSIQLPSNRKGDHDPLYVLQGHISYLSMVNPEKGDQLKNLIG